MVISIERCSDQIQLAYRSRSTDESTAQSTDRSTGGTTGNRGNMTKLSSDVVSTRDIYWKKEGQGP